MGDDKSTVVRQVRVARGRSPDEVACLEVTKGSRQGEFVPLTTGATLIGRAASADLSVTDDGVSRQHAKVAVSEEGVVTVLDLDSTNGTFVNGARVDMAIVREGDRLDIGPDVQVRFLYRRKAELAAADPKARAAEVGLSPRELEVAVLVADGLTSQEIADTLHISPRTVSKHLGNIYDRLGLPGRAALARLVVQRGLLTE
ncbi:MAG: FHA domain-containing protein [Myxococcota bacterium]